ncbi:MAG: hypothetical protein RBR45_14695 [Pseudomonas sp.]|nr:hypothetical protein [Pseudomonas sp.]
MNKEETDEKLLERRVRIERAVARSLLVVFLAASVIIFFMIESKVGAHRYVGMHAWVMAIAQMWFYSVWYREDKLSRVNSFSFVYSELKFESKVIAVGLGALFLALFLLKNLRGLTLP